MDFWLRKQVIVQWHCKYVLFADITIDILHSHIWTGMSEISEFDGRPLQSLMN